MHQYLKFYRKFQIITSATIHQHNRQSPGYHFTYCYGASCQTICNSIILQFFKHCSSKLMYNWIRINQLPVSSATGVNFTNILWAAFAPKSFCQKITNPNCKHLKAAQRTLVWLSISPIFYKQLFHTKVPCAPFMCLQFGFVIFWRKEFWHKSCS